jgi:hypothetical protein
MHDVEKILFSWKIYTWYIWKKEEGKTCKGKPVGSRVGVSRVKKSSIDGNQYLGYWWESDGSRATLVVLGSAWACFGAVCPFPGNRGSTHPCGNIANVGKIMFSRKVGKIKK